MSYAIRTIVVGVPDLEGPDPVLASAADLAERLGAELHVVRAYEVPHLLWDAYLQVGVATEAGGDAEFAREMALALKRRVAAVTISDRVHCHAVRGTPADAIHAVAEQEDADLVIIGAGREGMVGRHLLGTTAQRVLRRAAAPVLVLRGALPRYLDRVLLTTDLSHFSASVHEIGLDVLETACGTDEAAIQSLLVVAAPPLPHPLRHDLLQEISLDHLTTFLRERRPRGTQPGGEVRFGGAAAEIVAEATEWRADLVVLGTHGRAGFDRFMLGSVAEGVLRDLRCSALVVPVATAARVEPPLPAALAQPSASGA